MTTDRPRLLVCAYAFSPVLGSEFAQGWNYVIQMSQRYRLTVLVGSSDGRMGDFKHLTDPAVAALGDDVEIVAVEPDRFCRFIKRLDVGIGLTWMFVFGLRRWHRLAFARAKALHAAQPFAAVHQLGPVGFRNPGFLHRLGVPAYWGPIGGFQYVDLKMAWRSSPKYGALCVVRNLSTWMAARSRYVRSAMKGFDRLSFATATNLGNAGRLYGRTGPVLSDQATVKVEDGSQALKGAALPLNAVWCGSVDARKNINLFLDVAKTAQDRETPIAFTVIGSGPLLEPARQRAEEMGLRNLTFAGQTPRPRVQELFQSAHLLCFTSLSEANTSTLFEALEAGCVPFALDLDGFTTNIPPEVGYTFDIAQGWDRTVANYAQALDAIARDPALRQAHAEAIRQKRHDYSWDTLAGRHAAIIDELIGSAAARPGGADE